MPQRLFHVLLVEDNPAEARLVSEAFRDFKRRHQLHAVSDGEAALDFLYRREGHSHRPRPRLILLDINLPKKDGFEVLRTIKTDPKLRRIPVIMLTGSNAVWDVTKAYDYHANAYLQKPTDIVDYLKLMQKIEEFWLCSVEFAPDELKPSSAASHE